MEVLSKGVHRVLVPMDSQMESEGPMGVELVESASSYKMLTQMDVLRFIKEHSSDYEIRSILSLSLQELGAINFDVYAITDRTKLIDAIRCLKTAMLNAVPIVTASDSHDQDHKHLIHVSYSLYIVQPDHLIQYNMASLYFYSFSIFASYFASAFDFVFPPRV